MLTPEEIVAALNKETDLFLAPRKAETEQEQENQRPNRPRNRFARMHAPAAPTLPKAGHLHLSQTEDGSIESAQFKVSDAAAGSYRPLIFSSPKRDEDRMALARLLESPSGTTVAPPLVAHTPNGTEVVSKRAIVIHQATSNASPKIDGATKAFKAKRKLKSVLLIFSPERKTTEDDKVHKPIQPAQPSNTSHARKRKTYDAFDNIELSKDSTNMDGKKENIKGGEPILLRHNKKPRNRKLDVQQNTVMGKSAKEEIMDFLKTRPAVNDETITILNTFVDKYAMEWLHACGYALSPADFEPQNRNNLGAGPKWINTFMMVLEEVAGYFVKKLSHQVTLTPKFKMLNGSDIIEEITYKVCIQQDNKIITLSNSVKALEKPSSANWPSSTDALQVIAVARALLMDEEPIRKKTLSYSVAKPATT